MFVEVKAGRRGRTVKGDGATFDRHEYAGTQQMNIYATGRADGRVNRIRPDIHYNFHSLMISQLALLSIDYSLRRLINCAAAEIAAVSARKIKGERAISII